VVFKHKSSDLSKASTYQLAVAAKSIHVTSPNGGETLGLGEIWPIRWEDFGNTGSLVKIQITRNGGIEWTTIADNVPNTGVYNWTVSGKVSSYAKIRVTSASGSYSDVSDATFSVVSRSLTLTSPNGGESWTHATSHTLTWTSSDVTGNVKLGLNVGGHYCVHRKRRQPSMDRQSARLDRMPGQGLVGGPSHLSGRKQFQLHHCGAVNTGNFPEWRRDLGRRRLAYDYMDLGESHRAGDDRAFAQRWGHMVEPVIGCPKHRELPVDGSRRDFGGMPRQGRVQQLSRGCGHK
jgi:hypothetical protein